MCYMLTTDSLVFSTIMLIGMLYMPESPRFLMHKGRILDAFRVWKRIRGTKDIEAREEFFVMKVSTEAEEAAIAEGAGSRRFPWVDFFTKPRARRAIIYANIIIFLGQFTGINAIMYYMSVLFELQLCYANPCQVCPHVTDRLRPIPGQLHESGRWWQSTDRYYPRLSIYGKSWQALLGYRYAAHLLRRSHPRRCKLPCSYVTRSRRALSYWIDHLRDCLRFLCHLDMGKLVASGTLRS